MMNDISLLITSFAACEENLNNNIKFNQLKNFLKL